MQQNKKRQHYVPQFFLGGFAHGRNKFFALRRGETRIFKTNVRDACVYSNLYENRFSQDMRDYLDDERFAANAIENELSKSERDQAIEYKRILSSFETGNISAEEIAHDQESLCRFLFHLIQRHPSSVSDNNKLASEMAEEVMRRDPSLFSMARMIMGDVTKAMVTIVAEQAIKYISIVRTELVTDHTEAFKELINSKMTIYVDPVDCRFITADMSVGVRATNEGFDQVFFPMSSRCFVVFSEGEGYERVCPVTSEVVVELNRSFLAFNPFWTTVYAASSLAITNALKLS